jgi:glycosyltransferase involved in cell wall biosynthesis
VKVSGFSFLRDGVRLGYPFEESIRSALPVCDEFIVAVGRSDDGTLERLRAMNEPKLRLIETTWNEACRSHGFVYGQQKMIAQYNCTGDWAFYLEADEVLHEQDLGRLQVALRHYLERPEVEALAFDYHHFYGDANHVHVSSQAYRRATRIIRNSLRSIAPDGLYWAVIKEKTWHGGRNKRRTRYPRAAALNIPIYHYGNARHERYVRTKAETGNQYWSEKQAFQESYGDLDPEQIASFDGTHPPSWPTGCASTPTRPSVSTRTTR